VAAPPSEEQSPAEGISGFCVSEVDEPSDAKPGDDEDDDDDEEDEEEEEYEYEEDDDYGFISTTEITTTKPNTQNSNSTASVVVEPWREPSKQAVSMSLRAERETTGGKRRLASDLYKIMTADTQKAGFDLKPKSEDSMDKWLIHLHGFDKDSNLAKDMAILGIYHIELEMTFPDQYPFEPPFVRVVSPKFKRQTGFVMNGALCMELLTKEGWNPVNDIESVIVSVRSLLVVGDGRLQAAVDMSESKRAAILAGRKRDREEEGANSNSENNTASSSAKISKVEVGQYSASEAQAAYSHLSDYHKKKGWDNSGWWAKKG